MSTVVFIDLVTRCSQWAVAEQLLSPASPFQNSCVMPTPVVTSRPTTLLPPHLSSPLSSNSPIRTTGMWDWRAPGWRTTSPSGQAACCFFWEEEVVDALTAAPGWGRGGHWVECVRERLFVFFLFIFLFFYYYYFLNTTQQPCPVLCLPYVAKAGRPWLQPP